MSHNTKIVILPQPRTALGDYIIQFCADSSLRLSDLAQNSGVPMSAIYKLLNTGEINTCNNFFLLSEYIAYERKLSISLVMNRMRIAVRSNYVYRQAIKDDKQ
jgi:predicted transcriptional regulator